MRSRIDSLHSQPLALPSHQRPASRSPIGQGPRLTYAAQIAPALMSRLCPSPLHVASTLHAARSFRALAQSDHLAPSVLARGRKHHPCREPASHPLRLFLLRRLRHALPTLLVLRPSQQPAVSRLLPSSTSGISRASAASLARRIQPTASARRSGLVSSFERAMSGLSAAKGGLDRRQLITTLLL